MARLASPRDALELSRQILASPRLSSALATTSIGAAVFSFPIRQLSGWAGLIGIIGALVVLGVLSLAAQWKEIGWSGLLPISLLAFVGWATVTIFWSQYQWATLGGLAYLFGFTVLGIYVALARDTIQIVRAFGDVLRFALGLSLGLEILSGLLIDMPITLLGITGKLGSLGPIQGVFNTRDQLGLVAVIALVTFWTELRTKSVQRGRAIASIVLAVAMLLLTRAPLAFGACLLAIAATAALLGLRRASAESRRYWQVALLLVTATVAVVAWVYRSPIVNAFNAGGDLTYRLRLWQQVWALTQQTFLQGAGWVGTWPTAVAPFDGFSQISSRIPDSALNGYLDVWFQLGVVGFAIFLGFLGLTFTRSWLLASRRRSIVFAWPALVLVVLLIGALAESSILVEFGWLALVVCSVKASRELSWRTAFDAVETGEPDAAGSNRA
jgi:O-antigen ligase